MFLFVSIINSAPEKGIDDKTVNTHFSLVLYSSFHLILPGIMPGLNKHYFNMFSVLRRYYGYRNPQNEVDSRLKCLSYHRNLFQGKDILDIGCNIGHITLSVARDFGAKSILGIDIDKNLIGIARKNTKYYVKSSDAPKTEKSGEKRRFKKRNCEFFPISMPILYGPIDIPGLSNNASDPPEFPNNVTFKQVSSDVSCPNILWARYISDSSCYRATIFWRMILFWLLNNRSLM